MTCFVQVTYIRIIQFNICNMHSGESSITTREREVREDGVSLISFTLIELIVQLPKGRKSFVPLL